MTNTSETWQAAYRLLEHTAGTEKLLSAWVQPLELESITESPEGKDTLVFHFLAQNEFAVFWIHDHFEDKIKAALEQVTGKKCELHFAPQKKRPDSQDGRSFSLDEPLTLSRSGQVPPNSGSKPSSDTDFKEKPPEYFSVFIPPASEKPQGQLVGIDERFFFENFIVGASNQFSHASALAVADNPGGQYNPLFIYSSPGLGKTHLLHAIGNHIFSKNPKMRVAYLSAENFINELIDSLQHQKMAKFRAKYRESFDVLLIDDIQFIAGKKSTEEEFFHTFNALHMSKRQIVVTSDRPPKEIEKLEERIRTRFEWGLVADISPPEIETRIAILKNKAERDDIYLPDEAATFLAAHIKDNVRELEGFLVRLQARASLTGTEISLEMARQELRSYSQEADNELTVESIQNVVAKHFGIKPIDLKSSVRQKNVALPRQIAMFLARKYMRMPYKDIGVYFGGKDHSTIMHACKKLETSSFSDPSLKGLIEQIQNQL